MGVSWSEKPSLALEAEVKLVAFVGESVRSAVLGIAVSRRVSKSFSRGWWSCSGRLGMADMICQGCGKVHTAK